MPTQDFMELGTSGLRRQGGVIYEEFLPELSGERWSRTVREMVDQDPIVGAFLFAIESIIRQVRWQVKPFAPGNEHLERAEFVDGCLHDMSFTWQDTLSEIVSMIPWGWSFLEVVYKKRQGMNGKPNTLSQYNDDKIGWRKWSIRAQDTLDHWEFDKEGGIQGMWQYDMYSDRGPVFIPIGKAFLFRTTSRRNNPEGRSVLRRCYRPYYFKRNMENVEGIGVERDLAGLPIAYVPSEFLSSGATAAQQAVVDAIKDIVVSLRRDELEGVVFPMAYDERGNPLYKLELLTSGGQRQFETNTIIERYEARMAMAVLADFILIGHERTGSFALADSKTEMFRSAMLSYMDGIAETINRFAIPKLLEYNGWPPEESPKLIHGDVGRINLEELGTYIVRLAGAGFQLNVDRNLETYLRQQGGLPLPGEMVPGQQNVDEMEAAPLTKSVTDEESNPSVDGQQNAPNVVKAVERTSEASILIRAAARILANVQR